MEGSQYVCAGGQPVVFRYRRVRRFIWLAAVFLLFFTGSLYSDELEILLGEEGDAYIEFSPGMDGLMLYVRNKPGLGSVLITESSADPSKKSDSFAFRAWDYNDINGDEKRILDGKFLESERELFFLVDSTPEPNEVFGSAFRIFIPFQLTYGYPWSREGQVEVHQGTWLNIRTFEKPYADYLGRWRDNPVLLNQKVLPPPPAPKLLGFDDVPVMGVEEALDRVAEIIGSAEGSLDVVLVLDTTISMKNDVGFIQDSLVPLISGTVENFDSFRVGLVLYRDYKEAYLTRHSGFTDRLIELQARLERVTVSGGRDLDEAVYEGLYSALTEFEWEAPQRMIIQIGDAGPHSEPQGAITRSMVEDEAARLGVSIYPIRLPDDLSK